MVAPLLTPRNEERLRKTLAGWESPRGTPAVPTLQVYQMVRLVDARPLSDTEEDTGGFDPFIDSEQGAVDVTGTVAGKLTFEDVPIFQRLGVAGGVTPTSDGGSPAAYTWPGVPTFDQHDLDSLTVEVDAPDNVFVSEMLMLNEWTVSGDIDGAAEWQINANAFARNREPKARATGTATSATSTTLTDTGAGLPVNFYAGGVLQITGGAGVGQERLIVSNTATAVTVAVAFDPSVDNTSAYRLIPGFTTGVPARARETIRGPGTRLYIDDLDDDLGDTLIEGRFISFSFTANNSVQTKRFLEDEDGVSTRTGRGSRLVTGQIRIEWDRERVAEARQELERYMRKEYRRIRIERLGSEIAPGVRKFVRIDVPRALYSQWSDTPRNGNMAVTLGFRGHYDESLGYSFAMPVRNALSTI